MEVKVFLNLEDGVDERSFPSQDEGRKHIHNVFGNSIVEQDVQQGLFFHYRLDGELIASMMPAYPELYKQG